MTPASRSLSTTLLRSRAVQTPFAVCEASMGRFCVHPRQINRCTSPTLVPSFARVWASLAKRIQSWWPCCIRNSYLMRLGVCPRCMRVLYRQGSLFSLFALLLLIFVRSFMLLGALLFILVFVVLFISLVYLFFAWHM